MRKLSAFLVALATLLVTIVPAGAMDNFNSANSKAGTVTSGCYIEMQIQNDLVSPTWTNSSAKLRKMAAGGATCAFMGLKIQIRHCDGTTSTSGELVRFLPEDNNVVANIFTFPCATQAEANQAGVIGLYFRYDTAGGTWMPPDQSPASWVHYSIISDSHGTGEHCYPDGYFVGTPPNLTFMDACYND